MARSLGLNWNCSKQSSDQNLLSVLIPNGLILLLNVLSIFLGIASGHSENQKELGSNEGIWQHLFQVFCVSPDEKTDRERVKIFVPDSKLRVYASKCWIQYPFYSCEWPLSWMLS